MPFEKYRFSMRKVPLFDAKSGTLHHAKRYFSLPVYLKRCKSTICAGAFRDSEFILQKRLFLRTDTI